MGMMRAGPRFGSRADCCEVRRFVTDYLDGALSTERRRCFEGHLTECAECLVYLGQIEAMIEALGRLRADDIPEWVLKRLCGSFLRSGKSSGTEGGQ